MTISTKAIFSAGLAACIAVLSISTNAYAGEKPRPTWPFPESPPKTQNSDSNAGTKKTEEALKKEELKQEELKKVAKKLPK